MLSSKKCENCGGGEHYSRQVEAIGGMVMNLLPGFGFFARPKYRIVVCGACGLTRWFVPEEFLPTVKKKYQRES